MEWCLEARHAFIKLCTFKIDFIIAKSLTLISATNLSPGAAVHKDYV